MTTKKNQIHWTLALILILVIFSTFALYVNLSREITSGTFIGRFLAFIRLNFYIGNYNLFILDKNIPLHDNNFYVGNLLSIAKKLKGIVLIITILSLITGLPPEHLILLPFGTVLTVLSYYTFYRGIFKSFEIALLSTIYILFYCIISSDQLGASAAGWTFILIMLFMLTCFKLLDNKDGRLVIISYLLYLGLFLYWHTAEAKALSYILSLNVLILLYKFVNKSKKTHSLNHHIPILLAMLVTTLSFKELLYEKGGYFQRISLNKLISSYSEWLLSIGYRLGIVESMKTTTITSPYYYYATGNLVTISTYASLILALVILVPIVASSMVDIKNLVNKRYEKFNKFIFLKWSLILAQFIFMFAYGLDKGAGPGMIFHFFPIASIIGIFQLRRYFSTIKVKKLISLFLITIVILNFTVSIHRVEHYKEKSLTYSDLTVSSSWFFEKTEYSGYTTKVVLTDFITAGKVLVLGAAQGILFNYTSFRPHWYQLLFEESFHKQEYGFDYMFVNTKTIERPISTDQGWRPLKPLSIYIDKIELNPNLDKVYSDSLVSIYARTGV